MPTDAELDDLPCDGEDENARYREEKGSLTTRDKAQIICDVIDSGGLDRYGTIKKLNPNGHPFYGANKTRRRKNIQYFLSSTRGSEEDKRKKICEPLLKFIADHKLVPTKEQEAPATEAPATEAPATEAPAPSCAASTTPVPKSKPKMSRSSRKAAYPALKSFKDVYHAEGTEADPLQLRFDPENPFIHGDLEIYMQDGIALKQGSSIKVVQIIIRASLPDLTGSAKSNRAPRVLWLDAHNLAIHKKRVLSDTLTAKNYETSMSSPAKQLPAKALNIKGHYEELEKCHLLARNRLAEKNEKENWQWVIIAFDPDKFSLYYEDFIQGSDDSTTFRGQDAMEITARVWNGYTTSKDLLGVDHRRYEGKMSFLVGVKKERQDHTDFQEKDKFAGFNEDLRACMLAPDPVAVQQAALEQKQKEAAAELEKQKKELAFERERQQLFFDNQVAEMKSSYESKWNANLIESQKLAAERAAFNRSQAEANYALEKMREECKAQLQSQAATTQQGKQEIQQMLNNFQSEKKRLEENLHNRHEILEQRELKAEEEMKQLKLKTEEERHWMSQCLKEKENEVARSEAMVADLTKRLEKFATSQYNEETKDPTVYPGSKRSRSELGPSVFGPSELGPSESDCSEVTTDMHIEDAIDSIERVEQDMKEDLAEGMLNLDELSRPFNFGGTTQPAAAMPTAGLAATTPNLIVDDRSCSGISSSSICSGSSKKMGGRSNSVSAGRNGRANMGEATAQV